MWRIRQRAEKLKSERLKHFYLPGPVDKGCRIKFQIQNLILEERAGLAWMTLILDCIVCICSIHLYSAHVDLPASVSFLTESFERRSQPMKFKHWKLPLLQVWPFRKDWYCRRGSGKAAVSLHCLPKLSFCQGLSARKREMSWDKIKKPTQMFKQYPLDSENRDALNAWHGPLRTDLEKKGCKTARKKKTENKGKKKQKLW